MADDHLLLKAATTAGEILGLEESDITLLLKEHPQDLSEQNCKNRGSIRLIELYKLLAQSMGGDKQSMRHWMKTRNRHFDEIPLQMAKTATGLERLIAYLESLGH